MVMNLLMREEPRWRRADKMILSLIVLQPTVLAFLLVTLYVVIPSLFRVKSVLFWMYVLVLPLVSALGIGLLFLLYKERKGQWVRAFLSPESDVLGTIDTVLTAQHLRYRRLGPRKSSLLTYVDVFESPQDGITVKVQKEVAGRTIVGVGPVAGQSEFTVERLKTALDEAFRAKGL